MDLASAKEEGRFRVGLIVPSSNTTMEVDFYNHLEEKATVHIARMYLDTTTKEAEEVMVRESTPEAADMIRTLYPHVTVFGCTSGGSLFGMDYDRKIAQDLTEWTGAAKTVTVLEAVGEQFRHVGAKRIAVFTPYVDELNETIRRCLEEEGFEVLSIQGMGITVNFDIGLLTPEQILAFGKERFKDPEADALFFSCTNMRAVDAMPLLEKEFGKPIVSSNQAAVETVNRIYRAVMN
ncbi:MAG: Asp/Glu racemase [Nitrospinota bacterium]